MITLRRAAVADAPVVGRFVDALLVELSGGVSKLEQRVAVAARLLALEERIFGFLGFEAAVPVAVMMLSESLSVYAGGALGVITELYVVPDKRSTGVAAMLVERAAALGRERGWSRVEVGAPRQPQWERSLKFYLRAGFTEIGPRLQLVP